MSGMDHNHSAKHHAAVDGICLAMLSHSCGTNCVNAELLNISRKVLAQVMVVQTGAVVLDATPKSLALHLVAVRSSDIGPPPIPFAFIRSYSILRI